MRLLQRQFRNASHQRAPGSSFGASGSCGKLAAAKRLTAESTSEQAGAGLDSLTDKERKTFTRLNQTYTEKFGFPFIIAVKGLTKNQILTAFETRVNNSVDEEFSTACRQVERIALLRLKALLP